MPINELIAQGVRPLGAGLPQVAGMLQEKKQAEARNALLDRQVKMQEDTLGFNRGRAEAQEQAAAQRAEMERLLSAAQWAQKMPKAQIESVLPDAVQLYESQSGPGSWAQASDEAVHGFARFVEAKTAAAIGIGPPQQEDGGFTLSPGSARFGRDGKMIAGVPPAPRAPDHGPAPSITTIDDPTMPGRSIAVDVRKYRGGGMGAPGVIGVDPATKKGGASPAQSAVDRSFGADYVKFVQGGAADSEKSIAELRQAHNELVASSSFDPKTGLPKESEAGSANLTGPVLGVVPKWARDIVAPTSADTQELIEQTVQRSLRAVLGAQFTEKEGERLISRAYNPRLPEHINAQRVGRLLTQLEAAHANKIAAARYYEEHGTLSGFAGKFNYGMVDFNPDIQDSAPGAAKDLTGMTNEELLKALGAGGQ